MDCVYYDHQYKYLNIYYVQNGADIGTDSITTSTTIYFDVPSFI